MMLGVDTLLREEAPDTFSRDGVPDLAEEENFRLRDELAKAQAMRTQARRTSSSRGRNDRRRLPSTSATSRCGGTTKQGTTESSRSC